MEGDLEVKIEREIVFKESTENLDFLKAIDFATEKEIVNSDFQFTTPIDKGEIYFDAIEAPISTIRKMLDKAEEAGANYVSIDFHCDHGEYDIYGLKISRASSKVVDEERESEMILDEAKKNARISELEEELKQLKKK
jgi:hypothetical protein